MKWILPVRCRTKQRPRVTRRGTFMPKVYTAWKQQFRTLLLSRYGPPPLLTGDLAMEITVRFKHKARGDADNYAGAVMDACSGLIYPDDRQVKRLEVVLNEDSGGVGIELEVSVIDQSPDGDRD